MSCIAFNKLHCYCMAPKRLAAKRKINTVSSTKIVNQELQSEIVFTPSPKKKQKSRVSTLQCSIDMTTKVQEKGQKIVQLLAKTFPSPEIPLNFETPFQLLVAVILSAQTTDLKVNTVTPALFELAPDAQSMSGLKVQQIAEIIKVLGLSAIKAKNLSAMSQMLMAEHGGQVPASMEALEALPGVGHKTASVVLTQAFGIPTFPVDTHIHRLAQRWGLTTGKTVEQTEVDLKALISEDKWGAVHLQMIYFGRVHCPAMRHDPSSCPICSWAAVHPYNKMGSSPPRPGRARAK